MENFFTMEYLIAYAGFVVVFILYLVADSKVKKLQRKCSILLSAVSQIDEVRNLKESYWGTSDQITDPQFKDVVFKLQQCISIAADAKEVVNKK